MWIFIFPCSYNYVNNFWPINVSQKIVCNLWEDRRGDFLHPISHLAVWNVNLMAEAVWLASWTRKWPRNSNRSTEKALGSRLWRYHVTLACFPVNFIDRYKKILYCCLAICNLLLSSSFYHLTLNLRTTLMVQWLGIHLVMKAIRVPSRVQEDPPYLRATKPMLHNY